MTNVFTAHGGSIRAHLEALREIDPKFAEKMEIALIDLFSSENGLMVLELLTKSILHFQVPLGVDDRALREIHGQRHLVAEIRQMVAHGPRRPESGTDRKSRRAR